MTAIPVERIGRVTGTADAGQFVRVRDGRERTGGFLIFQSAEPDIFSAPEVSGSWVERQDGVGAFFADAGWVVERSPRMAAH